MSSKILSEAVAKAEQLPEADQETIGRELDTYVEKLHTLRADLVEGIRSLDAGKGKELDIEAVITRARGLHAKS